MDFKLLLFFTRVRSHLMWVTGRITGPDLHEIELLCRKAYPKEGTINKRDLQVLMEGIGPDDILDEDMNRLVKEWPLLNEISRFPYVGIEETKKNFNKKWEELYGW